MQNASPFSFENRNSIRFSVAPMLDWTDRYYRRFARLLTKRSKLYTEMVVAQSLAYGDPKRHLDFSPDEHPLALQLGGSDPQQLSVACRIAEEWGYDEINLNVGCPSDRVQSGRFGACLMAEPRLVASCVEAMVKGCSVPVSVKTRIGIDHQDDYPFLNRLAEDVMQAGCDHLIIHARKAWLKGLSPRENRAVPPLQYDRVRELKEAHPQWQIVLNGGIKDLEEALSHLEWIDGVMVGRAAYETPWLLHSVDQVIFGERFEEAPRNEAEAVRAFYPFIEERLAHGDQLHWMSRHLLGLFQGRRGARAYRRTLAEEALQSGAGIEIIEKALAYIE